MKEPPRRGARGIPVGSTWSDQAGADLTWGVGVVAARLGVAASTLRTWERRYGVGPSHRTHGGHRRYTERDIDRVELVRRLVSRGVSAQDAARVACHLDREELRLALAEHDLSADGAPTGDAVEAFLAAAVTQDLERLGGLLDRLLVRQEVAAAWTRVLSPALARMAAERSAGALAPGGERAATALVADALRHVRDSRRSRGAEVLLASGADDSDCLPLLALGAALVQSDVTVQATGPELDPRALADLTRKLEPRVVVLWDQPPGLEPQMQRHLEDRPGTAFLLRASAAWPHEIALRFGADDRLVATDVGGTLRHILDRVP